MITRQKGKRKGRISFLRTIEMRVLKYKLLGEHLRISKISLFINQSVIPRISVSKGLKLWARLWLGGITSK
jgi:hypothetical protein